MLIQLEEAELDEPFLFELYAFTRAAEIAAWGWNSEEQQTFLAMQYRFQQQSYRMQYPNNHIQLIRADGQQVGKLQTADTGHERVLVDIIIAPSFRNAGIGTKLIEWLQKEAREAGLLLRLTVKHDNPAKRLYDRLGFVIVLEDQINAQMQWTSHEINTLHML